MKDLASPVYHWTPQKIRVHMFFSYLAYMFLALLYNRIRTWITTVSLISVMDILDQIRIVYAVRGSRTVKRINARAPEGIVVAEKMKLLDLENLSVPTPSLREMTDNLSEYNILNKIV